jgi:hypothetical protein
MGVQNVGGGGEGLEGGWASSCAAVTMTARVQERLISV